MLESLRSFVGSWVAKILLGLLVLSFAVWGVSGTIFSGADQNTVAAVGDTKVTVTDYLATYNRNINQVSAQVGRGLTQEQARLLGVEQRTLADILTSATLDEFSREMNMSLSEDMLARMLADNPAFQGPDGRFDRFAFQQAVFQAGLRESDYIRLQNGNAIRSQVMEGVAEGDVLPAAFENALTRYATEERKFDYITITPALAGEPTPPTDQQLQEYFEANKARYAAPEYRKLVLVTLLPQDIADEASVSAEAVSEDYERRQEAFRQPEQRRVQQIVLSADKVEATKKALADGATFETILSDNGVSAADADLGLIARNDLPEALRDPAFSLAENAVSDIVDGPFGPTLLRVTEIKPEQVKPLSEVEAEIRKEIALSEAADRVIEVQTQIEDARAGGSTLAEAAERYGLKVRTVEAVDQTGRDPQENVISDLPLSSQLLRETFRTEVGEQTSPLDYETIGSLWYEVADITAARDRTFDEVKDRARNDWLAAERAKQTQNKAEELKKRLDGGATLASIAEELGTQVDQTGFLRREGSQLGFPATAVTAGFSGSEKSAAIAVADDPASRILMTVSETKRPEAQLVAQPIQNEINRAQQGAANDILQQLIANLQSGYEVTYNPELMEQALARR